MTYSIDNEQLEKLKNMEGSIRGVALKTDEHFIVKNGDEETMKRVQNKAKEMGADISYEEIDKMAFYPFSWRVISLLAVSQEFSLDEEGIKKIGEMAPRASFLIKFFAKHFMSVERTLSKVSQIWSKHYTVGTMEALRVDEQQKEAVFRLHDFNAHPILCAYLIGYLSSVVSMVIGEKAVGKEVKCSLQGDDFHEFYITWKQQDE